MPFKSIIALVALVAVGFAFFALAIDNGFWHGEDFLALEHSLRMQEGSIGIFESGPPYKFQPLVYGIYYLLFNHAQFNTQFYFIFNILLHGFNSFLVYLLVNTLLKDRTVALFSGFLFVFTVGSYGKSVMIVSGLEDLVITTLTLLTMYFYFKNELDAEGKLHSHWFFLTLIFFIASMLTRSTSLSIIGAFLAFNLFFRGRGNRRIFRPDFFVLLAIAVAALIIKTTVFHYTPLFYTRDPGVARYIYYALKNIINYLVRMIFPIHTTNLVAEAGAAVRFVYSFATEIRVLLALTVLSYSVFGFVFGNRTIRFFIAWTYIMVLPFAFFQFPNDWLNIRHLYLVSVGFIMVISAGAVYCSRLIASHRWRRLVPILVPVFFVILARFIVTQLDGSYELKAKSPKAGYYREDLARKFQRVVVEDGQLRIVE
ncbi:MAG: hypothetical protein JSV33_07215 [bacterium]|nr:MAG: hypothetical protein JSV33_07215 [bacterium]